MLSMTTRAMSAEGCVPARYGLTWLRHHPIEYKRSLPTAAVNLFIRIVRSNASALQLLF
jgi:hypothetical protein